MSIDFELGEAIAGELGLDQHELTIHPVSGGEIARAHVFKASDCWVFVKSLPLGQGGLLSAEADGLQAIAATSTIRVPRVIRRGITDHMAWLALEYLELTERTADVDARLGRQLADLHRHGGEHYGWRRNNYIGLSPQVNRPMEDWTEFFLMQRLAVQFDRLSSSHPGEQWSDLKLRVFDTWHASHARHRPEPCLVHGDLWHGNAAALIGDAPVVFDPAVHYGDRESDLAMARLFGGFSEEFFTAYEQAWPLPHGHEQRLLFYKLYHVLNHANIFGGGYLESVRKLSERINSA
jgi:protein-ribulosamine 3-kinase